MSQTIQFYPKKTVLTHSKAVNLTALPPLALYIHVPWCVKKCPYCDFNSHELKNDVSDIEADYVNALLVDLEHALPLVWGRRLVSIFIGGGTPSVLSVHAIERLLSGVRARLPFVSDIEITMEANPGTLDNAKLKGFRDAGVNRISLGVQSFDDGLLKRIGRIHSGAQARAALDTAYQLFDKVNLDIMFALPEQTLEQLQSDVRTALTYAPTHLSYYHMTIEPNTYFHRYPPKVPDDELALDMQAFIEQALEDSGMRHYEVSAYAKAGHESHHNTNYWQFGDYVGIGAGAHSKISAHDGIIRQARYKHPQRYLDAVAQGDAVETFEQLSAQALPFEFMLNALRLRDGVTVADFYASTGLGLMDLQPALEKAQAQGLMEKQADVLRVTDLGWRFLSDVQTLFLNDSP
ncbi:radical SAM family heme chaperone HemW [Hydromonas duriensis]|uniref:Heme chaperone HemW n=1 Tax=Hydromonas duriensis TaxID=1527608 RepID=A0A4R6Y8E2_9BURK|nr:radical SAM family heme chaperone HemW [Hydromonas duriensis]TDR31648.1 anaerobic coproporphyrinogen III oxidase [Hydromonas duriensis]